MSMRNSALRREIEIDDRFEARLKRQKYALKRRGCGTGHKAMGRNISSIMPLKEPATIEIKSNTPKKIISLSFPSLNLDSGLNRCYVDVREEQQRAE